MIADPARRWTLAKRTALIYLAVTDASITVDEYRRSRYSEYADTIPAPTTDDEYDVLLNRMRTEAVNEHEHSRLGGQNCHAGTAAFLAAFGFEPMPSPCDCGDDESEEAEEETERVVTVTMIVQLTVRNSQDLETTEDDVANYLSVRLDTSSVDDVTHTEDVEISEVHAEYTYR